MSKSTLLHDDPVEHCQVNIVVCSDPK